MAGYTKICFTHRSSRRNPRHRRPATSITNLRSIFRRSRHDEENGESLDEHVFTLSFARSYHGRLGFEVAVPWIVENRSGQTRRRIGDLHASLKAASALAGPLMHGIGLGTGVPTDEDGHAHIEPSYSIGYPGRRLQSAVSLSLEIPFRDGDEDTTLKYTTYMLAVVWERLHIIGEILGERIVRGEERGENSLDVAAGFRVFRSMTTTRASVRG